MNLKVPPQTINEFVRIAEDSLKEKIRAYYNEKFIFHINNTEYSFSFFKKYFIIIEIHSNKINNIYKIEYRNFWNYELINWITDNILLKILYKENYLNFKLNKFLSQIENDLYMEFITTENNILSWDRYHIAVELDEQHLIYFVNYLKSIAN